MPVIAGAEWVAAGNAHLPQIFHRAQNDTSRGRLFIFTKPKCFHFLTVCSRMPTVPLNGPPQRVRSRGSDEGGDGGGLGTRLSRDFGQRSPGRHEAQSREHV